MNKEQAAAMLPIVQAIAEGKTVQYHGTNGWYDLNGSLGVVTLRDKPEKYRIKPEPRVYYAIRFDNNSVSTWDVEKARDEYYRKYRNDSPWEKLILIEKL